MQPVVETLSGLERRVELSIALADIEKEVQAELKRAARKAKAPGFRPGKVPMSILERSHAPGIRYDVINSKVGQAFEAAVDAAKLRVAGMPSLEPKTDGDDKDTLAFVATFEVYPEVIVPEIGGLKVTRTVSNVGDAEIERTVEILRKQRARYETSADRAAQDGDRVILDFAGTIDGVAFEGGQAQDFPFVLGQGRMLPEFETAVRGLKAGESKVFPLDFPADYGSAEVAGKQAEFTITVKEVAEAQLPELDSEFAKQLGQADGDIDKLRADIRENIEREAKSRSLMRTKGSVMDALAGAATFDIPRALVDRETQDRVAAAREELKQRGLPNAESIDIPKDAFAAEAERRVRLGLLVSELVKAENLKASPEQVRARIEEFAQSYEQPEQVVAYYLADRQRRAEIEAIVLEDNVVDFVLNKADVTEEDVPFEKLMGSN
ncbi:MAG: trigger factor [Corticimicrobacter sp.]|uniref:trigger factor n=1 Tax=Corticimicrobacter sp. TaxID=2678536 RepID=UPI0032D9B1B2